MKLYIDTTSPEKIIIAVYEGRKEVAKKAVKAARRQGEKLIPSIDALLKKSQLCLKDISGISVVNRGGSFTSLRIGVITANALAFALGIPVEAAGQGRKEKKAVRRFGKHRLVVPEYDREPDIGRARNPLDKL